MKYFFDVLALLVCFFDAPDTRLTGLRIFVCAAAETEYSCEAWVGFITYRCRLPGKYVTLAPAVAIMWLVSSLKLIQKNYLLTY